MDKPSEWFERLDRSKKEKEDLRDLSIRYKKAYTGIYELPGTGRVERDQMVVNFVYTYVEAIMASVFGDDPKIALQSRAEGGEQNAKNLQANINYWFYELGCGDIFEDVIRDHFYGMGCVETSWNFEEAKIPTVAKEDITFQLPDGSTAILVPQGKEFKRIVTLKDEPMVKYRDYFDDIMIDPDAMRIRDARWIASRDVFTKTELDKLNIPEAVKKKIKPSLHPKDNIHNNQHDGGLFGHRRETTSKKEWFVIWNIWDATNFKKYMLSPGFQNEFLDIDDWPYILETKNNPFPFAFLHGAKNPFAATSFSEFRAFEDQIWELIRLRSVQQAVVKRMAPRYIYSPNTGTASEIKRFLNSNILSASKLRNPDGIKLAPMPDIPATFFEWGKIISDDLSFVSALNEIQQDQSSAKTATEASITEGRSSVRKSKRVRKIESFVTEVAGKVGMLVQQFQSETLTLRIQSSEGTEFLRVSPEDMQGEFDYRVIADSMQHTNKSMERREAFRAIEVLKDHPETDQRKLAEKVATTLNMAPGELLLSEEKKAQLAEANKEPPEPTVKIKDVDVEDMNQIDRQRVIEEAKKQAGIKNFSDPQQALQQAAGAAGENGGLGLAGEGGITTPINPIQDASLDPFNG